MKITFYGHACFGLEIGKTSIIIDPFISANELASHVDIDSLLADYILITHAHQDHILDAERIAKRTNAIIISNYEIVNYYLNKGINGHPLNHGGTYKNDAFSAKYTNAVHTSSFPDGSYGGQPGGFLIQSEGKVIYVAGDTALTKDMELIPMMVDQVDLALMPIGDNFTMGVDDTIIAAKMTQCKSVIGCHFNTFPLIEIDTKEAISKFRKHKINFQLLEIGASLDI